MAVLSSIFLYAMGNTMVAVITPAIVNDLGDATKLPWLAVGFQLGASAMVLPVAKLYGLFDAKWLYITSVLGFATGSVLCGAAKTMNVCIVGRVISGVGGVGMYLGVMNIVSSLTTDKERPGYIGFLGISWGIGTVLGPVVGGGFVGSHATWRWSFYVTVCAAGIFMPVCLFLIPSVKQTSGKLSRSLLRSFDSVGAVLSVGGVTSLVLALNLGRSLYEWNSPQIIALFAVAGLLFILLACQQGLLLFTTTESRIFPVPLLRDVNALLLFAINAGVNAAGFIPIYYTPLYFQFSRGDEAMTSAIRLLPLILPLCAFILASSHAMARMNYFQPLYISGSIFGLVGSVLLSRITPATSLSAIYGYEVMVGAGVGTFCQCGYTVIQAVVPVSMRPHAIGYMML
ncbi:Efflux pump patC, partial [Colletotrichum shisoi]